MHHTPWFRVSALAIGGFGPIALLGTFEQADAIPEFFLDLLAWPLDGGQAIETETARFLCALLGGVMMGWGAMLWRLSGATTPRALHLALITGMLTWFVADSAGSIAAGVPMNVIPNVAILLITIGPLWRPARAGH